MNRKTLISIAIPTYNRASCLRKLLSNILNQIEKLDGLVEVCISNNNSTDNTSVVVADFQKKYPNLINYNGNKENLGADRNILKVMEMSRGDFIWLLGDDDMIVVDGIIKVVGFINKYCDKNTGLVILGHNVRLLTSENDKETVYLNTIEKGRPEMYKINIEDIMGTSSGNSFLSALVFNNSFIRKIIKEENDVVKEATGNCWIQAFLHQLMFLKYPQLKAMGFNEIIIIAGPHYRKSYVEDEFSVFYLGRKKINDLLMRNKYMTDSCKKAIVKEQKILKLITISQMGIMKAFGNFNYISFYGCIKLFYRQTSIIDASILSLFFVFFYIMPASILRKLYKVFIRIKYKKEWQNIWLHNVMVFKNSKVSRRITE